MSDETDRLHKRLARERLARKEAERILEDKSLALYNANLRLQAAAEQAENLVTQRTAQLSEALQVAEQANQAKSHFLANMSHEIRTPMNGIIGMAELAMEAPTEHERQECLHIVKRSALALLDIINDILDFSKIEAGKIQLDQVPYHLHQTVNDCVQMFLARAKEKNLCISLHVDPRTPPIVFGDPTRLRQVLINLMGNAIKFTKQGQIDLRVQPHPQAQTSAHLCFAVKDTGIGIAHDKLGSIFEAFAQADISTTRHYGGTGLGLTITQHLVQLMGGHMQVSSQLGVGSTFEFDLPLTLPQPEQLCSSPPSAPTHPVRPLQILVVEDHPVNQLLTTKMLTQWGHHVRVADNGQTALDELQTCAEPFDLVLMDMQMPVMDGLQATALIRQQPAWAQLPIVAMTANAMLGDREQCLQAGMTDYLSKPILAQDLKAKLQQLFGSTSALDIATPVSFERGI